ncbi:YecA family protein [Lactobacillus delbrueckii]|uniref:YecA family protein n=1 Tax=Lactobacillus delbrueckii TaxID=1584 RepID=UPI001E48B3A6|nr:SEC-C metal-binding domain-containing protein [Lactobacillus delbrueckii]MCD5452255.1 SEC-C domain-containing protein [Lactobacillus delbrueckii subsp. lactis]
MSKKIGRNEPCPCGSGLKYKKCCIDKSIEQRRAEALERATRNLKNRAIVKHCLHPDKEHCEGKIIKAHAIQNNRILRPLSENGEVITVDQLTNYIFQDTGVKGRKQATTFSGFCSYHDKTTFQPIEDREFVGSPEQIFLLTYRTLAWHYQKKLEQLERNKLIAAEFEKERRLVGLSKEDVAFGKLDEINLKRGLTEIEAEKNKFDVALLEENYSIWKIPYEVDFAISMMNQPSYDLEGNQINDITGKSSLKNVYLNIFQYNGSSFCIWSWCKDIDNTYSKFVEQFLDLEDTVDCKIKLNTVPIQ